jgi:TonB family protein
MAGRPGAVAALVEVGANGAVYRVEVTDQEPYGLFEDQTRRALRRWRFEPARDAGGEAVASVACQVLLYQLTGVD